MVNAMLTGLRNPLSGKRRETNRTVLVKGKPNGSCAEFLCAWAPGSALAAHCAGACRDGARRECKRAGFREKRGEVRDRARLRSAKLMDSAYRFLCEARIYDRSRNGLRIMLARDVRLPGRIAVHIDESREVRCARTIWRRGSMLGVRLLEPASHAALKPSARFALRERYYGIPD